MMTLGCWKKMKEYNQKKDLDELDADALKEKVNELRREIVDTEEAERQQMECSSD